MNRSDEPLSMSKFDKPPPFYISLLVNGLLFRNCMLDLGSSANTMTLEVINELGLIIYKSYRNAQALDSR